MEDDLKLSRFYNGLYLQGDRSTTYAERAADCKLARLAGQLGLFRDILAALLAGYELVKGQSPHDGWAHNQHSENRRLSNRDRIVTTRPSRFQPPAQKCCAEMMSVSAAGIPKNRCRTTVAEPIGGNASGAALYRGPSRSV